MKFRVLGPLAVVDEDGDEIAIGSPTQRVLLASLLAAGGKIVSSESLIDVIWEDDPPRSAESSLRTYVSRLRNVLGNDELGLSATAIAVAFSANALVGIPAVRWPEVPQEVLA